jgi:hypothetical protein
MSIMILLDWETVERKSRSREGKARCASSRPGPPRGEASQREWRGLEELPEKLQGRVWSLQGEVGSG